MAYLEQVNLPDAVVLYSNTYSMATVSPAIDTTGYGNIVVQLTSAGPQQAYIEGSHDQVEWFAIMLNPLNDISVIDQITLEGGYQFKTSYKYIRINSTYCSGSCTFIVLGRAGQGDNAADNIVAAFNPDTPIQVAFGKGVKQDNQGALILSDGVPYYIQGNNTYLINLNGYSSIMIQLTGALTVTATQSIDGTLWTSSYFGNIATNAVLAGPNAAGIWTGPVVGQYLKLVVTGAVGTQITAAVVLKSAPMNMGYFNQGQAPVNMTQHAGTAWQSGGVAGVPSVAGSSAAGSAVNGSAPFITAGVDPAGVVRRALVDAAGRVVVANAANMATQSSAYITGVVSGSPSANAAYPLNAIGVLPATFQQSAALNVQDTALFEGQSTTELLALVLLELRILNQQMYELPRNMATNNYADPPELMRQEQSIFNI